MNWNHQLRPMRVCRVGWKVLTKSSQWDGERRSYGHWNCWLGQDPKIISASQSQSVRHFQNIQSILAVRSHQINWWIMTACSTVLIQMCSVQDHVLNAKSTLSLSLTIDEFYTDMHCTCIKISIHKAFEIIPYHMIFSNYELITTFPLHSIVMLYPIII